ncbi:putative H4MPT-linked C1 transfer pathway protein [Burkholderiales bacterium JOSHI_001]|nr:putative H4MPT-linked C1 transfer pathway protein [Burkholderiales bacterium JOSHI_001]
MKPSHRSVIGWDVGGAHVKACWVQQGRVHAVAQWPCPLWQGLQHLDAAIAQAQALWPLADAHHGLTMTGEMADLFPDREAGVAALAARLAQHLGPSLVIYAGAAGWLPAGRAARHWRGVASANWRLTAEWLARQLGDAVLVDIGSTTTDLVPLHGGQVASRCEDDAQRLAHGELVYQGVARTPLCALGPQVRFDGDDVNLMNELFATSADVYRLTGDLDPAHDQHPAADGAAKDKLATQQRLARLIGRDARDASDAQWLALAHTFRQRQVAEIHRNLQRVLAGADLPAAAPLVAAGCGAFLVPELAATVGRPQASLVAMLPLDELTAADRAWAGVCAPAVAAALLAPGPEG